MPNLMVSDLKTSAEWVTPGFRSNLLNVLPDHEHLLHGTFQHGKTRSDRLTHRVTITEWAGLVKGGSSHL